MASTITWVGGSNGNWSAALDWSLFSVPTAADDVVIPAGDTVTVDVAAAAANLALLAGPPIAANLDIVASLTLGGTLSGVVLLAGTLTGGTLDGATLIGQGGTLAGVAIVGMPASQAFGDLSMDAATAAGIGQPIAVAGTLTLLAGTYDATTFTLDPTAGFGTAMLASGPGVVTLAPGAHVLVNDITLAPGQFPPAEGVAGLIGSFVNQGTIGGDIGLTITGPAFTNAGALSFTPAVVQETTIVAPHSVTWLQGFGPTVAISSGTVQNAGLIAVAGGTLTLGGSSVDNSGTIALADAPTAYYDSGTGAVGSTTLTTAVVVNATSFTNTGSISADLIDFAGPVSLSALGAISGALQFGGTLDLGGGTLSASAYGTVTLTGLVENGTVAAGTGTLILDGATLDNATVAPGGSVVAAGQEALLGVPAGATQVVLGAITNDLILPAATTLSAVTITTGGAGVLDLLTLPGGVATLAAGAAVSMIGGMLDLTGSGTLADDGSISVAAGSLNSEVALVGSGSITVGAGATLTDNAALGGALSLTVGAGAIVQIATLDGNAAITLDAGARVTIDALAGTPRLVYAGAPALAVLPGAGALPITLQNLGTGDLVDFAAVSAVPSSTFAQSGAAEAGGSLDVTGASGDTASVPLSAPVSGLSFAVTIDPTGGTLVTAAAACYRAGTRIATASGLVPIERLRRGDLIRTAAGRLRPAIWLGRRRIDCRRHPDPATVWPVRVQAHAFAPGRPARDLFLSPDHAVWCDGVLIPVRYLLNGASIAQCPVATVEYWHVELPVHDVVLAEHLPAESYLDTGNRGAFAGMPRRAVPAAALRIWRARGCAPLRTAGPSLAALHARLLARAHRLGHGLSAAPVLRVLADGRAATTLGGQRFRLPAGAREVRLLSRSFVPAHLAGHGHDPRRLGVAIGGIRLDGTPLPLDDPRLQAGWHAPEPGWRWTAGDAVIAAVGARELALDVAIAGRYWQAS